MKKKILIYGGTGQAIILKPIIEYHGSKVVAVVDDTPNLKSPFNDVRIYEGRQGLDEFLNSEDTRDLGFVVAIGNDKSCKHQKARVNLSNMLEERGLKAESIIHPSAYLDKEVKIGKGVQILAGARLMARTEIGDYCIINTSANIDHESKLEIGCEVAPSSVLCGCVDMQKYSWVGANATILPKVKISPYAIVGAGAVVTKDVEMGAIVVGNPAKIIRYNKESMWEFI